MHEPEPSSHRKFRAVYLYQTIVYAHCIESGKAMFHGGNLDIALCKHGSALSVYHLFGHGIYRRLTIYVNSLDFVTRVFWCRIKRNGQA